MDDILRSVRGGFAPQSCIWSVDPAHFVRLLGDPLRLAALAKLRPEDALAPLAARERPLDIVNGVAVVRVRGVLDKLPNLWLDLFGGTTYVSIRRTVEQAVADPKVGAVMLAIDSPGGTVDGLAEVADAVFAARKVKPVVAQVDGMAASAAYYLASQAGSIYAHRMDMVGSIGTRLMLYDWSRLFENEGVEAVPIDTGEFKSAGAQGTEITKSQRKDFQRIVDAYFEDFLAAITRGRAVPALRELADGRMFLATEAKANGLIDGIQTFEQTLSGMTGAAGAPRRARADLDIRFAEVE